MSRRFRGKNKGQWKVDDPCAEYWTAKFVQAGLIDPEAVDRSDAFASLRALLPEGDAYDPKQTRRAIQGWAREILRKTVPEDALRESSFHAPIERLGERLRLSDEETTFLHFVCAMTSIPFLKQIFVMGRGFEGAEISTYAGVALEMERSRIHRCMSAESRLVRTGLLDRLNRFGRDMEVGLTSIAQDMILFSGGGERDVVEIAGVCHPEPAMSLGRFPHLARQADLAARVLGGALREGGSATHMLLHGPPGTGKTEFARALAASAGASLYEVRDRDQNGDPRRGDARLGIYQMLQALLEPTDDAVILYDECEGAFVEAVQSGLHRGAVDKSFLNHVIEEGSRPSIWILNDISDLHESYRRRFDLVLEVPSPTLDVRRIMVDARLEPLGLSESSREHLSRQSTLCPAAVEAIGRSLEALGTEPDVERVLPMIYESATGRQLSASPRWGLDFDPSLLKTDPPLDALVDRLRRRERGRMLFSGPPGTGKTAFARHMAERLDRDLIVCTASDILGPYVGQTEAQIAAAFRRARATDSVLFFDEIESILFDRSAATRSWERSQVTELLVRLENFDGIFVAATNRVDDIDPAALRRFGLKVEFSAPGAEARELLFRRTCAALAIEEGVDEVVERLRRMDTLCPGDFVAVMEHCELVDPAETPAELLELLRGESALRDSRASAGIGFGA